MQKEQLLTALKAAGESTRLRLLALCACGELSVSELTLIVSQSQPRVSRHLKMLVEAGLLERFREGAMVFYRISDEGDMSSFAQSLIDMLPSDDGELNRDFSRLESVKKKRTELAQKYFNENAARWNEIRTLHVPEEQLEEQLLHVIGEQPVNNYLDIGTGTGRVLALMAGRVKRAVGLDINPAMLNVARDYIEQKGMRHVHIRKGDMYNMPVEDSSVDLATLHLVLHYAEEAGQVVQEAARVLVPGGRLIIVDFALHHEDYLRTEHRHVRLGFSDAEISAFFVAAGMQLTTSDGLDGDPLTVKIWHGVKRNT